MKLASLIGTIHSLTPPPRRSFRLLSNQLLTSSEVWLLISTL